MAGTSFVLPNVSDEEVEKIGKYLQVRYDKRELRLIFHDPEQDGTTFFAPEVQQMLARQMRSVLPAMASLLLNLR